MMRSKQLFTMLLVLSASSANAAQALTLTNKKLSDLQGFSFESGSAQMQSKRSMARAAAPEASNDQTLRKQSITNASNSKTLTRFQQFYKGVPVIGGQVTLTESQNVNGHLYPSLNLNVTPQLTKNQIEAKALLNLPSTWHDLKTQLQIRFLEGDTPSLVYQLSYRTYDLTHKPSQPVLIFDANTGILLKQWDALKHISLLQSTSSEHAAAIDSASSATYKESGIGGNDKTSAYWYGKDGLPSLKVKKQGRTCIMDSNSVRVVNLKSKWDWQDQYTKAHQYACGSATEQMVNGGYSPINDAFAFGDIIVEMYDKWYHYHALQNPSGKLMKLIMRVHFGEHFDNAFWDGSVMSYGDGDLDTYPLLSLDVSGHEVSHGFSQQHSGLEYHDHAGAINESFSDMAGIATRAYVLEKMPYFHQKLYLGMDSVNWTLGETIMKQDSALRYMDTPSKDGVSADCYNKTIALNHGHSCQISYQDVMDKASNGPFVEQGYVVHTASGIFNKAFYLMAQELGIKSAFALMVQANVKYWHPTINFEQAACGVLAAAKDLKIEASSISQAFGAVGVSIAACATQF